MRKKILMTIVPALLFCGLLYAEPMEKNMERKIKLTLTDGKEVVFSMSDNATSRDLLALLPASMDFEDYSRTEKVSYLSTKLSTDGAPAGYDPDVGDLCLYAPWGNLCIFYRDFGYAGGLIKLGYVVSGEGFLGAIEGPVRIEIVQ